MPQHLCLVAPVVRDDDEAIAFYPEKLGVTLVEDASLPEPGQRRVVVSPPGARETRILLARARDERQSARISDQTGGRVLLLLQTDDIMRDFKTYWARGVVFIREPRVEPNGAVAVFENLYAIRVCQLSRFFRIRPIHSKALKTLAFWLRGVVGLNLGFRVKLRRIPSNA